MYGRPRSRASELLVVASLGACACSLLAPPDENFLSPAHGGAGADAIVGGRASGGGRGGASTTGTTTGSTAGSSSDATAGGRGGAPASGGTGNTGSTGNAAGTGSTVNPADPSGGVSGVGGQTSDGGGGTTSGVGGHASGGAQTSGGGGAPASGGVRTSEGGTSPTNSQGGVGATSGALGAAGQTGSSPTCSTMTCGANAHCVQDDTGAHCVCDAASLPDGLGCRLAFSCNELHQRAPTLPSGIYSIQPPSATRTAKVYCDMKESGGGWTLILNEGADFMPKTPGSDDAICYEKNCTSSVYATLPLASDILLDVADEDIIGANYAARIRILGVNSASRGKTLRDLFTSGPNFLERGDNGNLEIFTPHGEACEDVLPPDFASLVCDTCESAVAACGTPVITLGDADSACNDAVTFAIGASDSESESWTNCAGWPQAPFLVDSQSNQFQYYPTNFRVWLR
ncbi:MAG TPA: fibrinogen-like YCDxxxxGGGW domain-containing protein [Polyangiaceae bacterium]|nr:fibrinogen-like YCDxxxxGGGW domain-containing protein [Polyangiaceae bacterium]